MDTSYILDTSVAVKWFSSDKENHLLQAGKLLQDIQNNKIAIFAPEFLLMEVANALLFSKKLDSKTVKDSCQLLLQSPIIFTPLTSALLFQAIKLAESYHLTIYDAVYLSLAQEKLCKIITSDRVLSTIKKFSLPLEKY